MAIFSFLQVSKIRENFENFHKISRSLMESLVVKNFKKYKDILTILDAKYTTNKNTITELFKNILPKIRLGGEDGKLTEIFKYS